MATARRTFAPPDRGGAAELRSVAFSLRVEAGRARSASVSDATLIDYAQGLTSAAQLLYQRAYSLEAQSQGAYVSLYEVCPSCGRKSK